MLSTPAAPSSSVAQATALQQFFEQYPEFDYNPEEVPLSEFHRMCRAFGWGSSYHPEKNAAREEFNAAMKDEFNSLYGSDEKDIRNWEKLCHVLSIEPVPKTLSACRHAVLEKHVNLVDLVQAPTRHVRLFPTEKALSEYTLEKNRIFPKEDARDGGVLRALRRHILDPKESRPPRNGQKRRGKKGRGAKANTTPAA
ncbi:hypothetical protein BC834DRAFT_957760 [Gloeopeniophorella convolvens]|nr:hypothetical protein BC834DRAFT_957760 [Gloeopeniophorella convolvens]